MLHGWNGHSPEVINDLPPVDQIDVSLRWLIRQDLPEVLRIEAQSFEYAWTEEDFMTILRQRPMIGMVAEFNRRVIGFMIYELKIDRLDVLNFAVSPAFRRRGVGRQMVERLIDKLAMQRRKSITLWLRETNVPAQLFFGSMGFRVTRIERERFDECDEDGYFMALTWKEDS